MHCRRRLTSPSSPCLTPEGFTAKGELHQPLCGRSSIVRRKGRNSMRRKTLRWVSLAALAIAAAVFVTGAMGASGQKGSLSGKKVGVIICTNQNPFCAAWANTVKSGLEKQGASVTVLSSVFDPAVDAQNMNRLIADKPDLIISVPASASAIVPSYIRAKAAGIPILGAIGRQSADGAKIVTAEARTDDPSLGRFAAMNLVEGMTKAGFKIGERDRAHRHRQPEQRHRPHGGVQRVHEEVPAVQGRRRSRTRTGIRRRRRRSRSSCSRSTPRRAASRAPTAWPTTWRSGSSRAPSRRA